jgi:hypothetical protein
MINPYLLNIIGLGFDIFGAFLIAFYIMKRGNVDFFQKHELIKKLAWNKSDTENPYKKSERFLVTFGFILLLIGFILQLISNLLQYVASF